MSRNRKAEATGTGRLHRAANAVKRLFGRKQAASAGQPAMDTAPRQSASGAATTSPAVRAPRRQTDIPLDVLDRAYTPPNTSSKASFRSDGADHEGDQDFARGITDSRWNDEDRLTNKSGDPRIGTRGRTYEPGEARPESRD